MHSRVQSKQFTVLMLMISSFQDFISQRRSESTKSSQQHWLKDVSALRIRPLIQLIVSSRAVLCLDWTVGWHIVGMQTVAAAVA